MASSASRASASSDRASRFFKVAWDFATAALSFETSASFLRLESFVPVPPTVSHGLSSGGGAYEAGLSDREGFKVGESPLGSTDDFSVTLDASDSVDLWVRPVRLEGPALALRIQWSICETISDSDRKTHLSRGWAVDHTPLVPLHHESIGRSVVHGRFDILPFSSQAH